MPKKVRATNPLPDPFESVMVSHRPVFVRRQGWELWLPDARFAFGKQETGTFPLDASKFIPCPDDALHPLDPPPGPRREQIIAARASDIARWAFSTYHELVRQRLKAYVGLRKQLNLENSPSDDLLGRYRRACRLACEQILRRDLPPIQGLEWNYYLPHLPLYEIEMKFEFGTNNSNDPQYEIPIRVMINAVIEVRQKRNPDYDDDEPRAMAPADASQVKIGIASQPEWSSSSSSSSESDFDPR